MIVSNSRKEVDFNYYCKLCEHKELPETVEPCQECMRYPTNEHSKRPVNFIPKGGNKNDQKTF